MGGCSAAPADQRQRADREQAQRGRLWDDDGQAVDQVAAADRADQGGGAGGEVDRVELADAARLVLQRRERLVALPADAENVEANEAGVGEAQRPDAGDVAV